MAWLSHRDIGLAVAGGIGLLGCVDTTEPRSGALPKPIAMDVTETGPVATPNPAMLAFGNQPVGFTSASLPVTITNTGNADLVILALLPSHADFGVTSNCLSGPIAPGAACVAGVTFTPVAPGVRTGNLTIMSDATSIQVGLNGTGLATAPVATPNPASLAFGNQPVGFTSASLPLTITNTGNADLLISALLPSHADYGVTSNCLSGPIAPGAACVVNVTFTPAAPGVRTGNLTIMSDAALVQVSLNGTGLATDPAVSLSTEALAFGDQLLGTTSAPRQVIMTNTGTRNLVVSSVAATGAAAGDFSVSAPGCAGATVTPGNSCTIDVSFSPTEAGGRTASLSITDNASGGAPRTVALTGTGVTSADLGVSVGANPSPAHAGKKLTYTITLRNHGPGSATGITLTDMVPPTTTFAGISAPAGMSCTTPALGATGTIVCSMGSLASGQSAVLSLVVNALSGGKSSVGNTVTVTSASGDPVSLNNSATVNTSVYGRK